MGMLGSSAVETARRGCSMLATTRGILGGGGAPILLTDHGDPENCLATSGS